MGQVFFQGSIDESIHLQLVGGTPSSSIIVSKRCCPHGALPIRRKGMLSQQLST